MTKGSDLLVAALENEGVDRIFALPGEEKSRHIHERGRLAEQIRVRLHAARQPTRQK